MNSFLKLVSRRYVALCDQNSEPITIEDYLNSITDAIAEAEGSSFDNVAATYVTDVEAYFHDGISITEPLQGGNPPHVPSGDE